MPYARLTDRATLILSGEDAGSFLQNLVTADIPSIPEDSARPAALLTPQGKILFDFLLSRMDADFRLDCAASIRDQLAKRLTLYKLRSKVSIEQADDPVFAIWDETEALRDAKRDERFGGSAVYRAYRAPDGLMEATETDFRTTRIQAGVAEAESDFPQAEMFPHDVLLDQNNGVSFRKGCYVGQEVVSRMQHRGTARRRLMLARGERHLTEGANVTAGENRIGTLLAAEAGQGFAMIRTDKLAASLAGGLALAIDGVPVELSVPQWAGYALPDAASATAIEGESG